MRILTNGRAHITMNALTIALLLVELWNTYIMMVALILTLKQNVLFPKKTAQKVTTIPGSMKIGRPVRRSETATVTTDAS